MYRYMCPPKHDFRRLVGQGLLEVSRQGCTRENKKLAVPHNTKSVAGGLGRNEYCVSTNPHLSTLLIVLVHPCIQKDHIFNIRFLCIYAYLGTWLRIYLCFYLK